MGRSSGNNGGRKIGKESRCPERGGKQEATKTEDGMGELLYDIPGKNGRRMENNSNI